MKLLDSDMIEDDQGAFNTTFRILSSNAIPDDHDVADNDVASCTLSFLSVRSNFLMVQTYLLCKTLNFRN